MVKKAKVGKNRQDDYYHMAKSTGLRARSAFKLIEMNKKHHILEKSKILIDLCAAPGGWMQVAQRTMKTNSIIIGIDLVPIKPIRGTVGLVADITTDRCKQLIKQQIHTAKADVVLHDGAPNVGANWSVDGFAQAHLCLKAFALATEFLVKNGTFVTKVFRSKDYESLKWVLEQLFEKVVVEKPKSSRNESAEIFLVCLKYKAPTTIDPKFLDTHHVFEDVEEEEEAKALTFNKMIKMKKKADGYDEGDSLYKVIKLSDLLMEKIPMNIVLLYNKVVIDDEDILKHPLTTEEIKQYLMDLKLLSKFAFKTVEKWLKKITPIYKKLHNIESEKKEVVVVVPKTEEEQIDEDILRCETELKKNEKKKLKAQRKEKMKQIRMIQMNMLHPGDVIEQIDDIDMFSASKNQHLIDQCIIETDVDVSTLDKILVPMDDKRKSLAKKVMKTKEIFTKTSEKYYEGDVDMVNFEDPEDRYSDDNSDEVDDEEEHEVLVDPIDDFENDDMSEDGSIHDSEYEDDEEEEVESENSEDVQSGDENDAQSEQDEEVEVQSEEDLEDEVECEDIESEDEDECKDCDMEDVEEDIQEDVEDINDNVEDSDESEDESDQSDDETNVPVVQEVQKEKITDLNFDPSATNPKAKRVKRTEAWFNSDEFSKLMNDADADEESDSDDEIIEDIVDNKKKVKDVKEPKKDIIKEVLKSDDIVASNPDHAAIMNTLKRKLTPKERAVACELIKSKKSRREILEWGYNRYQFEEEQIPRWLLIDELKHMKPSMPFLAANAIKKQKEEVSTNINKRTIKKVEQAKMRKKNRLMRKLQRLNKRAEKIDEDMSLVEKSKKLKEINQRVKKLKNTKTPVVTEVTNKSGARGRAGKFVKGAKVKVVDPRMKADKRTKGSNKAKKSGRK